MAVPAPQRRGPQLGRLNTRALVKGLVLAASRALSEAADQSPLSGRGSLSMAAASSGRPGDQAVCERLRTERHFCLGHQPGLMGGSSAPRGSRPHPTEEGWSGAWPQLSGSRGGRPEEPPPRALALTWEEARPSVRPRLPGGRGLRPPGTRRAFWASEGQAQRPLRRLRHNIAQGPAALRFC